LTDQWEGLDRFFMPGTQILPVSSASEVSDALSLSDKELHDIADAARERTLAEHTGNCRIKELENICERVRGHASNVMCV
jgi:spore maturation protein CgeB